MSKYRFRRWIVVCALLPILYGLLYSFFSFVNKATADRLEALIPIALAVPVALLAGAFNRRNSYLQALRELWYRLVPAAQTAIQYTHLTEPSQSDFAQTQGSLSAAIDEVRGVFANVPTGRPPGLYPYENLKDIVAVVSWLEYGAKFRASDATVARRCIVRLWQEMHVAMLDEFDRDVPVTPVSKYLGRDGDGRSIADLLFQDDLKKEDIEGDRPASAPRRD